MRYVFPASPADEAGLKAGDRVTFATDLASLSELWRHPGLTPYLSGRPMRTEPPRGDMLTRPVLNSREAC